MSKTDAEIYADAGKHRWPYVEEYRPRPDPGARVVRRRPPGDGVPAQPSRGPKPLAPGSAAELEKVR